MDNIVWIVVAYLLGISLLLVLNEVSYRLIGYRGEYSRKIAHVAATLATLPFPYLFDSHWFVLGLALLFAVVLFVSLRIRQLDSIHDVARPSIGSFLLPISIYLTFLVYTFSGNPLLYVLPITILAVCDPVAAMVGMSFPKKNVPLALPGRSSGKTLFGSLAFFASSLLICLIMIGNFQDIAYPRLILVSLTIAILGTLAELVSWRGSDNLTIPLFVQLGLWFLI